MAATTNGAGIVRITRAGEGFADIGDSIGGAGSIRYAQSNFLDELPGVAFAMITLAYVVASLVSLL